MSLDLGFCYPLPAHLSGIERKVNPFLYWLQGNASQAKLVQPQHLSNWARTYCESRAEYSGCWLRVQKYLCFFWYERVKPSIQSWGGKIWGGRSAYSTSLLSVSRHPYHFSRLLFMAAANEVFALNASFPIHCGVRSTNKTDCRSWNDSGSRII